MRAAQARRREPAPGIFRLILSLPFPEIPQVNAYLLTGEEGATLVDAGIYNEHPASDHGWRHLEEALQACGATPGDITRLVVTHTHIDHYGMAGRLVAETGCELWMHERGGQDLDLYRHPDDERRRVRAMLADHGVAGGELDELTAMEDWRPFLSSIVEPSRWLTGGEDLRVGGRTWSVVPTPGHARSHICLSSAADGILVSGDHVLPQVTPHIDFVRGEGADPLGEFLDSLEKVEELRPRMVLPGHGRPFEDGAGRARAIRRHHERRLGSILQVIRRQACTADHIVDAVFGEALMNFHRRLAFGEALAHLAYLRRRGEVVRIEEDGTFLYRKASRQDAGRAEDSA